MHTTIDESQVLSAVYDEVQQRFAAFNDPAHGWEHIERVYSLAIHLARQESADGFIVGMAALLHDLGRAAHDESRHHADLSVEQASDLMARYQLPASAQEAIVHAIAAHSFSRGIQPRTPEARVVRDADRLDSLGAIGIARWAITGTMRRSLLTRTYNPLDPFGEHHMLDDERYMLDHFYSKLLKLVEGMSTETGRRLAEERTLFMRLYLDEFRRELAIL
ncbi:MAG TPA: HD domain-containing protein [Ktedonobacteraceae bacterium]|nr:HD domain-containing protein [Ktedonobacteraceae bacterium]